MGDRVSGVRGAAHLVLVAFWFAASLWFVLGQCPVADRKTSNEKRLGNETGAGLKTPWLTRGRPVVKRWKRAGDMQTTGGKRGSIKTPFRPDLQTREISTRFFRTRANAPASGRGGSWFFSLAG